MFLGAAVSAVKGELFLCSFNFLFPLLSLVSLSYKPCESSWSYLIEASDQRLSLLHHSSLHSPFSHPLYVILLVLLSHLQVGAARLQLPLRHLQIGLAG